MRFDRKRPGMSLVGIVLWSVMVGGSFSFVNTLGLFAVTLSNPGAPSVSQALANSSCKIAASGLPYDCTGNTNAPGSSLTTIQTFGNFGWAFLNALPTIVEGALTPGSIAAQWFGGIGAVINIGMLLLVAYFAWSVVGNRPKDFNVE